MLAHALRRLLWTIPALVGVSLVTFLFLSYVPDPTDDASFVARVGPADTPRLGRGRPAAAATPPPPSPPSPPPPPPRRRPARTRSPPPPGAPPPPPKSPAAR